MEIVFSSPLSSTYSLRNYDQSLLDNKLNCKFRILYNIKIIC